MDVNLAVIIIGWAGAVAVLIAYFMVSTKRLRGESLAYQLLNLAGGGCLIVNTVYRGAYPSSFVNVVWVGIALYAIAQARRARDAAQ